MSEKKVVVGSAEELDEYIKDNERILEALGEPDETEDAETEIIDGDET